MESFVIEGGIPLSGTVRVSGSKNAALPIMAACLMTDSEVMLENVPHLPAINAMSKILGELGCHIYRHEDGRLSVHLQNEEWSCARYENISLLRASLCALGPLLAKRGRATVMIPHDMGTVTPPHDPHVEGLKQLGAQFEIEGNNILATVPNGRLHGANVYVPGISGMRSILATINLMFAAALADGETVLSGCATEPEVSDAAEFLIKMGGRISGHGTETVRIQGVKTLKPCSHRIIPDRIEAGTFALAAAITGGNLRITDCNPAHLTTLIGCLEEMGLNILCSNDELRVESIGRLDSVHSVTTNLYPGFPSDLQAPMTALLSVAKGQSVVREGIFPDRFLHVEGLVRLGAEIWISEIDPAVFVKGVPDLFGSIVTAQDTRTGAAFVLAGLRAKGKTRIERCSMIDYSYERFDEKLRSVGAKITRE